MSDRAPERWRELTGRDSGPLHTMPERVALDEVVMHDVSFHIEMLSDREAYITLWSDDGRMLQLTLTSAGRLPLGIYHRHDELDSMTTRTSDGDDL